MNYATLTVSYVEDQGKLTSKRLTSSIHIANNDRGLHTADEFMSVFKRSRLSGQFKVRKLG